MRFFKHLFAALALLGAVCAHADVQEGKDYKLLNPPQSTNSGKKVEVLEFFYYECPHCYHLLGPLNAWEKTMPKDVELQFVPVIFRDSLEPMARAFYALEAMGQRKQLHDALFEALNVMNIDLSDEAKIAEFVAKHGVDRAKFVAIYNSFSLQTRIAHSKQMVKSYGVRGTPTIVVDGKYLITGLRPEETIRVLDQVVAMARKQRNKR